MLIWRCWLDKLLFNWPIKKVVFDNIIFNPIMLMLLFANKRPSKNIAVRFKNNLIKIIRSYYDFLDILKNKEATQRLPCTPRTKNSEVSHMMEVATRYFDSGMVRNLDFYFIAEYDMA